MIPHPSPPRLTLKVQAAFCIHLIAVTGPQRRPKVRILFIATDGTDAVYEGLGSWAKCVRWIKQLDCLDTTQHDLDAANRDFGRNRYAVLREVTASLLDIEALGLQRADRESDPEARDSSALALGPLFGR